jgi:hypothetical protein
VNLCGFVPLWQKNLHWGAEMLKVAAGADLQSVPFLSLFK